jgi:hypothetical protein
VVHDAPAAPLHHGASRCVVVRGGNRSVEPQTLRTRNEKTCNSPVD